MDKDELELLGESAAEFVQELAERHDILEVQLEIKAIKTDGENFSIVGSHYAHTNPETVKRVNQERVEKTNRIKQLLP